MGINQFLATRVPGLELVFGPLDRIYVLHKWLGIIAMVGLGLHDIIDADMDGFKSPGVIISPDPHTPGSSPRTPPELLIIGPWPPLGNGVGV